MRVVLGSTERRVLIFFIFAAVLIIGFISAISLYTEHNQNITAGKKHNSQLTELSLKLLRSQLDELSIITNDYAKWDATHAYINEKSNKFTEANFSLSSLDSLNVDAVAIFDVKRNAHFVNGRVSNLGDVPFEEHLASIEPEYRRLTQKGVLFHDSSIYLFVSAPISTSFGSQPSNGRFIFLKEIDVKATEMVSNIIGQKFHIISSSVKSHFMPINNHVLWKLVKHKQVVESHSYIGQYLISKDAGYIMPVTIQLISAREPLNFGRSLVRILPYFVAMLLLPCVMIYLLRSHITRPIRDLIDWLNQVDGSQLAEELKPFKHSDNAEMGDLSEKFSSIYNNLYQQHQFSQILLYSISDFIFTVDHQGNIDYCNPAATEWLSVSANKLYGQSFEFLISNKSQETPGPSNWLYRAIHSGSEYSGISLIRKFGEQEEYEWMEIQVSPMIKAADEPMGALVILRPKADYSS